MSKKCEEQTFQNSAKNDSGHSLSFEERSRNVFSSLDECSKFNPQSSLFQKNLPSNQRSNASSNVNRNDTEDFRNRESIFKLSEREESGWPPSSKLKSSTGQWERGRNQDSDFGRKPHRQGFKRPFNRPKMPDHAKNPSKYTKYSLADAPNVSDRSNSQAAFAFLKELSDRNANKDDQKEEENENPGKIKFQRPKKRSSDAAPSSDQKSVTSVMSKRVLPEAVVGRESGFKSSSSRKPLKVSSGGDSPPDESEAKKVDKKTKKPNTLSHLMYDDEEEC